MTDDTISLATIAYSAWAAAVRLYYPLERVPVWEALDDDDTRPWIAVAEAFGDPPDRTDEEPSIVYEFEHPLRVLKGKTTGRKVGPEPPTAVRVTRPTATELIKSQTYDEAEQDLRLALSCSTSTDDKRPFDWRWLQRTHPEDAGALRALVLCGWSTLQYELHDAWRLAELELAAIQQLDQASYEVVEEFEALELDREDPREPVLAAIAERRRVLAREQTVEIDGEAAPQDGADERRARAKTAAAKLWDELPELPDWFELTADGDNVTRDIWRQVADELAKADGGLRIFTPGLGFDRLEPKRAIETGDIVLRRRDKGERGVLVVVAAVCGVELEDLLSLHHDDYERVLLFGADLLGKSGKSVAKRSTKLSVRLRRSSARTSPSRARSTT